MDIEKLEEAARLIIEAVGENPAKGGAPGNTETVCGNDGRAACLCGGD